MTGYNDDITRIHHMLDFSERAISFNKGHSRADLDSNEMLAMATIHLIEMIGEASKSVSEIMREKYPKVHWEAISGTRNRLAHGYLDVDYDIIWMIVTKDLPVLTKQLHRILRDEVY